ncbi:hypothetical protein L9F63_009340, partial [Diploptera punctata]
EYPCDHYTAVINVTLMNTGCPRTLVHETALQLLQVLDKRFFGAVGPLPAEGDIEKINERMANLHNNDQSVASEPSEPQQPGTRKGWGKRYREL